MAHDSKNPLCAVLEQQGQYNAATGRSQPGASVIREQQRATDVLVVDCAYSPAENSSLCTYFSADNWIRVSVGEAYPSDDKSTKCGCWRRNQ